MSTPTGLRAVAVGLAALLAAGCASQGGGDELASSTSDTSDTSDTASEAAAAAFDGFPEGTFDYQLGASYAPPPGVGTVVRDSTSEPAEGMYSVCYVNGFQTQPGDLEWWLEEHPDLILRDASGEPVVDEDWPDERLLDTSTEDKRSDIADILAETVAACADRGFDAVEFDNLDSDLRSRGLLTVDDNLALAAELVGLTHGHGMAAGQKNSAEVTERAREEVGFDFAMTEECAVWNECEAYTDVYGDAVLAVEYPHALEEEGMTFEEACAAPGAPSRMILRDLDLVGPEHGDYVFDVC
ncbi:endo alpha-1,4 polygalactosaminidase [Nocardiopsis alborubida]|uniref:Endo alpha-1,4 polygalactosaminidase n=1 Tax=Nocardiopsis alborubida TaxID=146802 RepID=A0A7X6MA82_9ACTN|nr:endo alpha-1,4 polygalactosaminidase [Nocardiopsis alborubida]NKY97621.1 endo alpha-1,4 polygalactosaminidase [Nocardiopsis alborubida]